MIKMIAVDMDGTFLNSEHTYNKSTFSDLYKKMQQKDIKFVVASGNQYAQLKVYFPEKNEDIVFVAENGSLIAENGEIVKFFPFQDSLITKIIDYLINDCVELDIILCGVKSAYILESSYVSSKEFARLHYKALKEVASFSPLPNDDFVKISLYLEDTHTEKLVEQLNQHFKGEIRAVTSGNGCMDILLPNVTKGAAIQNLLSSFGFLNDELLAFGNANNDLEMLSLSKNSYAMANAGPEVMKIAKHIAPSNDDNGVFIIMEKYLH